MSEQFIVVDGVGDARNLIYATWLRCYQTNSPAAKNIHKDTFFAEHHLVLDAIFDRNPTVKLAVLPDDPSVVLGWSVTEGEDLVHFVYVKPAFRKYGLATALLGHVKQPFTYTHWTYVLRDLHNKVKDSQFNPYKAKS